MRSSPPDKTMLKNIVTVEGDLICILWLSFTMGLPWRRQWLPTPVLLPGKPHGRRSLVGCSPWGCEESDTTERLHFHFSLSCIPLENPRDGGAWWAAIYGVSQSQTQLKRLSSSSSIILDVTIGGSWVKGIRDSMYYWNFPWVYNYFK